MSSSEVLGKVAGGKGDTYLPPGPSLEIYNDFIADLPDAIHPYEGPILPVVTPHPKAPRASLLTPEELSDIVPYLAKQIEGGIEELPQETLDFIREVALVSLFFFAKYIAGYSGPFNLLNEELHLDMCNYRQSLMEPGCRGAMFIPRSHYKSTIVTEAATAWEILRDPDIRVLISGSTADKAQSFMLSVKGAFDSNEFMELLFSAYIPEGARPSRWNDKEIVVPNRSRRFREATVEYIGSGGASEGHHYDLIICDDLIGLKSLNTRQMSAAEMVRTKNWFWGSEKTLLVSVKESRVIVVGTRYATDDLYSEILEKTKEMVGCQLPGWTPNPEGSWRCYYRMCIENGEVIFPENWTIESYIEMRRDHYFTFMSQYMNYPQGAGLAELYEHASKECIVEWDMRGDCWIVLPEEKISLKEMNVVIAADPAATEKFVSAKTSRTAVGVLATDPGGRRFLIELRVGYVAVSQLVDWLFELHKRYRSFQPRTLLELQGPFRLLKSHVEEQMQLRKYNLMMDKVSLSGDKDARIRSALEPALKGGSFYVASAFRKEFELEKENFPQSMKKDILDMCQIGINGTPIPFDEGKYIRKNQSHRGRGRNPITGY